jgi:hypothetical protein
VLLIIDDENRGWRSGSSLSPCFPPFDERRVTFQALASRVHSRNRDLRQVPLNSQRLVSIPHQAKEALETISGSCGRCPDAPNAVEKCR